MEKFSGTQFDMTFFGSQLVIRSPVVGDFHFGREPIPVRTGRKVIRTAARRSSDGATALQLIRNVSASLPSPEIGKVYNN